jgi:hypothetical protein
VFEQRDIVTTNRNGFRIKVARNVGLLSTAYCPSNTDVVRSKPHSGRHRTLCLHSDNTRHSEETNIHARFEPAIPTSERPQTYALDRADRAGSVYHTAGKTEGLCPPLFVAS